MTFGKVIDYFVRHPDGAVCRGYTAGNIAAIFVRHSKKGTPYLMAKNLYGDVVPYTPTNSDMFATDWEILAFRGEC